MSGHVCRTPALIKEGQFVRTCFLVCCSCFPRGDEERESAAKPASPVASSSWRSTGVAHVAAAGGAQLAVLGERLADVAHAADGAQLPFADGGGTNLL